MLKYQRKSRGGVTFYVHPVEQEKQAMHAWVHSDKCYICFMNIIKTLIELFCVQINTAGQFGH